MVRTRTVSYPVVSSPSWSESPTHEDVSWADTIEWTPNGYPNQSACTAEKQVYRSDGLVRLSRNYAMTGGSIGLQDEREEKAPLDQVSPVDQRRDPADVSYAAMNAINLVRMGGLRAKMNLPVFIFEFDDSARALKTVMTKVKTIHEIAQEAARRRHVGNVVGELPGQRPRWTSGIPAAALDRFQGSLGRRTLRELSGDWLLVQLGVNPTVADCKAMRGLMTNLVGQFNIDRRHLKKGQRFKAVWSCDSLPHTSDASAWVGGGTLGYTSPLYLRNGYQTGWLVPEVKTYLADEHKGVVCGVLTEDYDLSLPEWLKQKTGFGLGPGVVGWELIPFSFVLDYFYNVGAWLTQMSEYQVGSEMALKWKDGIWHSQRAVTSLYQSDSVVELDTWKDPRYPDTDPLYRFRWRSLWGERIKARSETTFTRTQVTAAGVLRDIIGGPRGMRMNPVRLGTIAALLVQLFGPKGSKLR